MCGGEGVEIVYGLPGLELAEAAERGEVTLGGCVIEDDDPDRQCRVCGHRWSTRPGGGVATRRLQDSAD